MNTRVQTRQTRAVATAPHSTMESFGALQTESASERSAVGWEEGKKRVPLPRHAQGSSRPPTLPGAPSDVLPPPGRSPNRDMRASLAPLFRHDFSKVRVHGNRRDEEWAGPVEEPEGAAAGEECTGSCLGRSEEVNSNERLEEEAERAAAAAMSSPSAKGTESSEGPATANRAPSSSPAGGTAEGRPIPDALRKRFEAAFGWDFSGVRIHSGSAAAKAATEMGAKAFTIGHDVFLGDPDVENLEAGANRRVLAHELAHVIQQQKGARHARGKPSARSAGGPMPLSASLSAAPKGRAQALPAITGINVPAEVGVGRSITATVTVAAGTPAAAAVTWTLAGAPGGVTITPAGRRARITAAAGSLAGAGANFTVQAALTATPGDNFTSPPIALVGITAVNYTPTPPFLAPVPALIPATGPPNTAEANAGGLAGNTATVVPVIAPAARPAGFTVRLTTPLGATLAGTIVTPGTPTGNIRLRVTDTATSTFRDDILPVNPIATRLAAFTAQAAAGVAGVYGCRNTIRFNPSHAVAAATFNRIVGETITAGGRDDFGATATINGGPNPAPRLNLAVPANTWTDRLFTAQVFPVGAAPDANVMNVNRYVGPGVAATMPRVWILRQGFQCAGWAGGFGSEFDNGTHRRSLIQTGPNAFAFRTEHIFPGASAAPFQEAYVSPYVGVASPLINLMGLVVAPLAPAAAGLAADGVATAQANVATTHAGRAVNWSVTSGPIAFTVPVGGAAAPVANAATIQAGLVPGTFRIMVADSVFPNRQLTGNVPVVAVALGGIRAAPAVVPAGTLTSTVSVVANPGGRTITWTVDPAAAAAGVTVVPVAPGVPAAAARSATVTRPAAFNGRVTVTGVDSVLAAKRATTTITFR